MALKIFVFISWTLKINFTLDYINVLYLCFLTSYLRLLNTLMFSLSALAGKFVGWIYLILICCCLTTQLCPPLCDPMDCSTLGFPVFHHLLELAQTHVHWISDAIQPSLSLWSPSPPAFSSSNLLLLPSSLCIPVVVKAGPFEAEQHTSQPGPATEFSGHSKIKIQKPLIQKWRLYVWQKKSIKPSAAAKRGLVACTVLCPGSQPCLHLHTGVLTSPLVVRDVSLHSIIVEAGFWVVL